MDISILELPQIVVYKYETELYGGRSCYSYSVISYEEVFSVLASIERVRYLTLIDDPKVFMVFIFFSE